MQHENCSDILLSVSFSNSQVMDSVLTLPTCANGAGAIFSSLSEGQHARCPNTASKLPAEFDTLSTVQACISYEPSAKVQLRTITASQYSIVTTPVPNKH